MLATIPPVILSMLTMAIGIGVPIPSREVDMVIVIIAVAILFFAMVTFKYVRGWNLILLLTFSLFIGVLIGAIFESVGTIESWFGALLSTLILTIASITGDVVQGRFGKSKILFWFVSWIYVAGWMVLIFARIEGELVKFWGFVGLLTYFGISSIWFANYSIPPEPGWDIPAAMELYSYTTCLWIAIVVLVRG